MLKIISLPIGNAEDITIRALNAIKEADLIICEDTRMFHKLVSKLENLNLLQKTSPARYVLLNDFNEKKNVDQLILAITESNNPILVSDAGMPLISDPGYSLVQKLIENDIAFDVLPGATAITTALVHSGLSGDRIHFVGFLPEKNNKRTKLLNHLVTLSNTTIILFESPYRTNKTINQLKTFFPPETIVVVCRELTKSHQEVIRTTLGEYKEKQYKGEVTLLLRNQLD